MSSNHVSRRTLLRGIGTAVALPMLEGMIPTSVLAQTPKAIPVRLACLFVPNGIDMENWTPAAGALGQLPSILQPLNNVKQDFSILTGLAQMNAFAGADGPGDHARSTSVWLTGVHPKKTAGSDIHVGISFDQVAAQAVGKETKFASLEIGCERGALAGDCDSGYSCAYSSNVAWRSASQPLAKEVNPRLVFERLFGSGAELEKAEGRAKRALYNRSILDFVLEDANALKNRVGAKDKEKLEEYFQAVREVEDRVVRFESDNRLVALQHGTRPTGMPEDRGEHIRLMGDMMVLAFQADLTRICTFMFANDGSNRPYREIGIGEGHHFVSHHGKDLDKISKKRQIDTYHVQQLAYVLEKMKSVKEPNGTLLDNSMIIYGAGISDGDRHNHDHLPVLLAGRGGGKLHPGKHEIFAEETPMTNLFVSLLDRMGVHAESLGDSTGRLKELL